MTASRTRRPLTCSIFSPAAAMLGSGDQTGTVDPQTYEVRDVLGRVLSGRSRDGGYLVQVTDSRCGPTARRTIHAALQGAGFATQRDARGAILWPL